MASTVLGKHKYDDIRMEFVLGLRHIIIKDKMDESRKRGIKHQRTKMSNKTNIIFRVEKLS